MKSIPLLALAAIALAACSDPVADQATTDSRYIPNRADQMLAFDFAPGSARLDPSQESQVRALVSDRNGRRDEFVVVTDGSGGPIQQSRAAHVASRLAQAGAQWVTASVEPSMARGPDQVVVVRSEYRIAMRNCPTHTPSAMWNPNESDMPGLGCADAYNMGQMLARPRDAVVGRPMGPADGQVNADAVQRYRDGRVRAPAAGGSGGSGGASSGGGQGGGGGGGAGGGAGGATSGAGGGAGATSTSGS
jgi:pilus biogenesis lipoprotein CpaD